MSFSAILDILEPWKAVLASGLGMLAAASGIVGGVIKQRWVPDTTAPNQVPATRAATLRLDAADRDLIGDAREAATELTHAIRNLTGATEDNTEALNRRPSGGGGGRR
ncbi:hypothetical protein [Methylobacterium pseudosasicola]|uniref:Uncharacterized protein n=1 Tax=Methylobacterium pseudosasicola TaxID=582667 RepID=A0A1I4QNX5_9HYPH|nr:hypothetical protein [Methylobacterium pseudosasicola]SFM41410.1 hypothetical protein SAMN05192568_103075 [Methylobacterium pseudosasicola]